MKRKYIKRFDTILVSIDGRREITDFYRGKGVYDKVLSGIKHLRDNGFEGDLIARMAVSEKTDIFKDVTHLIELREPHFDHVHWQLDVLWDSPPYQRYNNFNDWLRKYNDGITRLVHYWLRKIEKEHDIPGIVPFLGIMKRLLFGVSEKNPLPCGAGINAFTITTSGRIIACPIAPEFEWNAVGDIYTNDPHELPGKVVVEEPCTSCELYQICGGRCLFANKTKLWGADGFEKVCETVKHLVSQLQEIRPRIQALIDEGVYEKEDFDYPKYNNTTEIIP